MDLQTKRRDALNAAFDVPLTIAVVVLILLLWMIVAAAVLCARVVWAIVSVPIRTLEWGIECLIR